MSADRDDGDGGVEVPPHPLGVKPLGAALFSSSAIVSRSLGALSFFTDAQLLTLLEALDARSLARLGTCSRFLYAACAEPCLWRTLALRADVGGAEGHRAPLLATGWRASLAATTSLGAPRPPPPTRCAGVYSDLFFKSWTCAAGAISQRWFASDDVSRAPADMDPSDFARLYDEPALPVVLTGVHWRAHTAWTPATLAAAAGTVTFDAGGFAFTMAGWQAHEAAAAAGAVDDTPLYLFCKDFAEHLPALAADAGPPPNAFGEDLFACLGARSRPDHSWLIVGRKRSGSVFHKDPNGTSAWNCVIWGAKKWLLWPPHTLPPGVHASADGGDVATTMSVYEWFLDFYEAAAAESARMRRKVTRASVRARTRDNSKCSFGLSLQPPPSPLLPIECLVRAGECIFVPRGWWHAVINVEDSVAVTTNFVSAAGLHHCLNFLQQMPHAISGVPPEDVSTLHARFVAAMREHHPQELARALGEAGDAAVTRVDQTHESPPHPSQADALPRGGWARTLAKQPLAPFTFSFMGGGDDGR